MPYPGLRQIGVVRRGSGVPVLPPADGTAVVEAPAPEMVQVEAWLGKVVAPAVDAFQKPDVRSKWLAKLKQGQQVAITSHWNGFYCIVMGDGSQGYVPQTHVELQPYKVKSVAKVAPQPEAPALPPVPMPQAAPSGLNQASLSAITSPLAQAVIREAFRYEGTPYVYGGNTESGIDCSGLVKNCFSATGVSLPRRASEQARVGQIVPLDQMLPGDRIYFSVSKEFDHTGIYLGDGYFIHAGRSRGNVGVDHLSKPFYARHLSAARR
jgi:cell wall-associated NlpC family hydrolase